jgi:hypothetical protein
MLKYTTKVKQEQFVGKVKINPMGGELTEPQVKEIQNDPWGKELIEKGLLVIEGSATEPKTAEPKK